VIMADLEQLSNEDLKALSEKNVEAMSPEGRAIAFGETVPETAAQPKQELSAATRFGYEFTKAKSDVGLLARALQVKAGAGTFGFGMGGSFEYIPAVEAYGEDFVNSTQEEKAAILARIDEMQLQEQFPVASQQSNGAAGFGGTLAGSIFSPTTLFGGGLAKLGTKGLAILGGGFGLEYNVLDQLASTARVDPKQAALATGVSAIATPLTVKAFSLLGTGARNALVGKQNPANITQADRTMREVQVVINEARLRGKTESGAQTWDELLPEIKAATGLSAEEIEKQAAQSTVKVKIPITQAQAAANNMEQRNAINPAMGGLIGAVLKGVRDYAGVVSTDLSRISPKLGGRLALHDSKVAVKSGGYLEEVQPFMDLIQSIPAKIETQVNRHLVNGEFSAAKSVLSQYDENAPQIIDSTVETLAKVKRDMEASGIKINKLENFFPRRVSNYKKLLEALGREHKEPLTRRLEAQAKRLKLDSVDDLPIEEVEDVIGTYMRQAPKGSSLTSKTTKARKLISIDDNLIPYYKKSTDSLREYIEGAVANAEKRNFFGESVVKKGGKNIDSYNSASNIIAREVKEGRISPENVDRAREMLDARFGMGETAAGAVSNASKNLIYQMTIANPLSALTQLADLGMSVFAYGLTNTLRSALGKKNFTLKQVHLENIVSAEMGTVGRMAKMLDTAFKVSGFKFIDRLGKETLMNAAFRKFSSMAKTEQGVTALRKRFGATFDTEFGSLVDDLRAGTRSENVQMLMFAELANFQPISLSQMPLKYLKHPQGRVFYALKSFTIKQLDVMRREILQEFAQGNTTQGTKNLIKFATIIPMAGGSVQELKDWIIKGDEIRIEDVDDQFILNIFKTMGVSRYVVDKAIDQGKITPALGEIFLPPVSLLDGMVEDISKVVTGEITGKDSNLIARIPVFGNLFQSWLLGARTDRQERARRERD
tara:strand:- start:192 stop:3017 length:2826 start_codon:yes stop_codon:yes gene_type:complete